MKTKNIYSSELLNISFNNAKDIFVQEWIKSPDSINEFKKEMLLYVSFYKKHKPKYTLWLQKEFSLELDKFTQLWLEENVNIPILKNGNKKCAFVISKDLRAHLSIIYAFDNYYSCLEPKHFVNEEKARKWLEQETNILKENFNKKLFFDGIDLDGNIKVRIPTRDIKGTLKSLDKLLEKENYNKINEYKINLLTKREKEILSCIAKHENHQTISEKLFISLYTVRTHTRNIKLKLDFKNNKDFQTFLNSFEF